MSFGGIEWVIILGIALLLFGPTQLPKLGKMLGKTMRQVREGMDTVNQLDPTKPLPEEEKASAAKKSAPVAEEEDDAEEEEA